VNVESSRAEDCVWGIGTASAAYPARQSDLLAQLLAEIGERVPLAKLARRVFATSQIDQRHFVVPDFSAREQWIGAGCASLREKLAVYAEQAPVLAAEAAAAAIADAGIAADELTHLVLASSTGVLTPGPDVGLAALLGLREDIERTSIGFMGCSAAFNAIEVGRGCLARARDARVLVVCVELCSLHRRPVSGTEHVVAQALFGDGAAALVLGPESPRAVARLGAHTSQLVPDSRELLTWRLEDGGFEMHLDRRLPQAISTALPGFAARIASDPEARRELEWLVHPGGAAILCAVEKTLGLGRDALSHSRRVLAERGNTSSSAILYVLERALRMPATRDAGVLLGFGPGLSLEALRFSRGGRWS
jgi:predicted naringenin-chalcone synthase